MCSRVETYSQFTDSVLLHIRLNLRRRDIPVSRKSLARCNARHLRIKRLVQFILVGAVYHNALTTCATLLCRAYLDEITCVAEWHLTLRTGYERHGRKNPLPFPYFRSGHMSVICARLGSKGKVGVQRGRKTAGCPSFLPTAVGTASPPRRAPRRSRRPQTANPPLRFSENLPARKGRTRLRQFAHPAGSVQKRSRPVRANTLTQFVYLGQPVPKSPADASCTGI